jgi:hypothetical protein
MIGKQGQINRDSSLGEIIYNICLQKDVKTIVEIGTWNGMGSTKCIYDAVSVKNDKYMVYTLECNEDFYKICLENYKNLPKLDNFNFILGTIIEPDENIDPISNFDDSFFYQYSREIQNGWRNEDVENCKKVKNVLTVIPEKIDLLILDGGEFSGLSEYHKLKDRTTYFILDDTNVIKNNEVAKIMRDSDEFEILHDSNDRNGYLVSKKIVKE